MAILSKKGILNAIEKGDLTITPFREDQLNPNSYDIRIDEWIAFYVLTDTNYESKETRFGLLDVTLTPNIYGHAAALPLNDPRAKYAASWPAFDLADPQHAVQCQIPESGFTMYPGNVYCAWTEEEIDCKRVIAELSGKSSIARSGVTIHNTAGYANIGDKFKYVIEITCTYPTVIYPHMKIGQIIFHEVDDLYDPEENVYDGLYANEQLADQIEIRMYSPDPALTERAHAAYDAMMAERERLAQEAAAAQAELERINQEAKALEEKITEETRKAMEVQDMRSPVEDLDETEVNNTVDVINEEELSEGTPEVAPVEMEEVNIDIDEFFNGTGVGIVETEEIEVPVTDTESEE